MLHLETFTCLVCDKKCNANIKVSLNTPIDLPQTLPCGTPLSMVAAFEALMIYCHQECFQEASGDQHMPLSLNEIEWNHISGISLKTFKYFVKPQTFVKVKNYQLHNEDGPALVCDEGIFFCTNGRAFAYESWSKKMG